MSKVAIKGNASGTGTFTVEAPNSNTDRTLTLPDEAGTVVTTASANFTGNVGVGTSPSTTLHVKQTNDSLPALQLQHNDGDFILCEENGGTDLFKFSRVASTNDLAINVINSASARFYTNNTERMRIDSSGSVYLGTTTWPGSSNTGGAVFRKTTVGRMELGLANTDSSLRTMVNFFSNSSSSSVGTIKINSTSTQYNTSSDYRLKENVVDMTGAITRVKSLSPKRFNFIADADTTVDGFLAHEAQTVVPEAVSGIQDGVEVWEEGEDLPDGVSIGDNKLDGEGNTIPDYQGIDQSKLIPLLTGALQEAIAKIETLETTVADLQTRVTALEATP